MSSSQSITLVEPQSIGGSGASAALDLGVRHAARLTLDVAAVGGTLSVTVETSRDGILWRLAGAFSAVATAGASWLSVGGLERYARATWSVSASGSATFSVGGDAHQVYASPQDLARYGLPAQALVGIAPSDLVEQLLAASALADGPLSAAGFLLPLLAWGDDLREAVAVIAAEGCLAQRGFSATGDDQTIVDRATRRRTWLSSIGDGGVLSPETKGTPPEVVAASAIVVSLPRRGWGG